MKLYGFDVETHGDKDGYGLQPFRLLRGEAYIKAASLSIGEAVAGTLNPTVENLRNMLRKAISDDAYMVGWNTAFDAAWCIAAGLYDEVLQVKWLDAMLLWKHLVVEPEGEDVPATKRKSFALKAAMHEFYPEHAGFKEFEDFQALDEESLARLLERNKGDVKWTVRLAEDFISQLTDKQLRAALIEARCIPLVAWSKVYGITSDKGKAEELSKKLTIEAVQLYKELLASSPEIEGINIGSPKQLQTLIYETWGLMADRFSKKTNLPSTDKYALYDLALVDPRCALLKSVREAKNNKTKYAKGTLDCLEYNGDGQVRPQARIFSTYTSRMTYASKDKATVPTKNGTKKVEVPIGIALHQWKRGKEYRSLIRAPKGYKLAEFDFAGQEFRWMAVASKDDTMLSLCAPGEDAHSFMGAQIAQVDYRKLIEDNKAGDLTAYITVSQESSATCPISIEFQPRRPPSRPGLTTRWPLMRYLSSRRRASINSLTEASRSTGTARFRSVVCLATLRPSPDGEFS